MVLSTAWEVRHGAVEADRPDVESAMPAVLGFSKANKPELLVISEEMPRAYAGVEMESVIVAAQ
jgi:hypothetical protein